MKFILLSLAVWRLTHMIVHDDGPFDLIWKMRAKAGDGFWGRLMDCPKCVSVWVAAPASFVMQLGPIETAVAWLALSGAAMLIEKAYGRM